MEDEKIIRLYWAREQSAISETDNKYGSCCRRVSFNILSSREDSEECVSDTYMAAWNSIPPQKPNKLSAFLLAIVRNISITRLRERYSAKRGGGEIAFALDELQDCLSSSGSVELAYEAKETCAAVSKFLSALSPDERRIFLSRYWLFEPTEKIAERAHCSHSRVRTSLSRTRKKLHEYLTVEGLI